MKKSENLNCNDLFCNMSPSSSSSSSSFSRTIIIFLIYFAILGNVVVKSQMQQLVKCPPPETILPCKCHVIRAEEYQVWCSHSDLTRVLNGLKSISEFTTKPIDELILENNNMPTIPPRAFYPLNVMRLMLRYNKLERLTPDWLGGLEESLMELFIVEPELRTIPQDILNRFRYLEAVTLQSNVMKRLPKFSGLQKLRYLQIESTSLTELSPSYFRNLPSLEKLHVHGSLHLTKLESGTLKDLPNLNLLNISFCGITWIHPRALSRLPSLKEMSLIGNKIRDASMIGRGVRDLIALEILRLDYNNIDILNEASFVDLPLLQKLYISNNRIKEINHGAFHRVPALRMLDLNYNLIKRIHPESFLQHSDSGLEELWLTNNEINHVAELRSLLDTLPRLVFLELSKNHLEEIRFGDLRGHPTLERLHLDYNKLHLIEPEAFMAMPALRELRLKNNSMSDLLMGPLWNLPSLKGLDLSGNFYRTIDGRLFLNSPGLRKIDMSYNEIVFLDQSTFMNTPDLESINLSGNAISTIHPTTFRHLINLYEIDLSHNRLIEIVPGLPRGLEYLHMSKNLISILPYQSPELNLPSLRMLDLSDNLLTTIQPGSLRNLQQLRKIYLGKNAIERIDGNSFDGLIRLEILDCHSNRIHDVHSASLKQMPELIELNLNDNHITTIRPEVLKNLQNLKRLYVNMNRLQELLLENVPSMEILDVSYNSLIELPSLRGLKQLKKLNLNKNRLRNVEPEMLDGLISLNELKISQNFIKDLRTGTFKRNLKNLRTLDLNENELELIETKSIASLVGLKVLNLSKNKIKTIENGALDDLPQLQVLELQENEIRSVSKRVFDTIPQLIMLNVSYNRLSQIDDAGIKSLQFLEVLDVSNNQLNRITSNELENMEWLVELKADNNHICAIHGPAFNTMPRLKVLSFRNNNMMTFPEAAVKNIRNNLAVLDLEGNPLACSCNLLWFQTWLQESSSFGPRCIDGTPLREVRFTRQECMQSEELPEPAVAAGCEAELLSAPGIAPQMMVQWMNENGTKIDYNQKNNNLLAPSPEESDYFYDDYVDYPYNETNSNSEGILIEPVQLIEKGVTTNKKRITTRKPNVIKLQNISSHFISGDTPTIYAASRNKTKSPPQIPDSPSSSGFTFFGLPLPSLNFNKLWGGSGRMADAQLKLPIAERKSAIVNKPTKIERPSQPEFQTGGFKPILPGLGGFKPIIVNNPVEFDKSALLIKRNDSQTEHTHKDVVALMNPTAIDKKKDDFTTTITTTTTIKSVTLKTTTESAITDSTIIETSEKTKEPIIIKELITDKPIEEKNTTKIQTHLNIESASNSVIKTYNNTNTQQNKSSEEEEIFADIETAPNLEPFTEVNVSLSSTEKPPQSLDNEQRQATLLTEFLVPKQPQFRGKSTVTKVQSPQETLLLKPLQSALEFPFTTTSTMQNNRETKQVKLNENYDKGDDKSWYFANYNRTNVTPYVGSHMVVDNNSKGITVEVHQIIFMIPVVVFNIV